MSDRHAEDFPNWFEMTPAKQNFEIFLSGFKDEPDLQYLQLGAYTGDASLWLLENVLTSHTSHLTDVDTWQGSDEEEHYKMDFTDVEKVYDLRLKDNSKVTKVKSTSLNFLRTAPLNFYDFIYVDADHTAIGVLLDAELSWDCLKSGGVLAFDDYEWSDGRGDNFRPMPGINSFLDRHKGQWLPVQKNWQLWIQKI